MKILSKMTVALLLASTFMWASRTTQIYPPLFRAIQAHDTATIKKVLKDDPHAINRKAPTGRTPLKESIFYPNIEVFRLLVNKGANLYDTFLIDVIRLAYKKQNYDTYFSTVAPVFLKQGFSLDVIDQNGDTALIIAARNGLTKTVGFLLRKGANITLTNNKNETALIAAQNSGHQALADLIKKKMNPGITPPETKRSLENPEETSTKKKKYDTTPLEKISITALLNPSEEDIIETE